MQHFFEDWQLDMIAAGDAPAEWAAQLAQDPSAQQRMATLRRDERALHSLFRVTCPAPLTLGEWHLSLLDEAEQERLTGHLADCPHCQDDLASIIQSMNAPSPRPGGRVGGWVRRIFMRLESVMDQGLATRAPLAVRGDPGAIYEGGDFMLSVMRKAVGQNVTVTGGLFALDEADLAGVAGGAGRATLRQAGATLLEAPLSSAATFTFEAVPAGQYDLIVATPDAELVVTNFEVRG